MIAVQVLKEVVDGLVSVGRFFGKTFLHDGVKLIIQKAIGSVVCRGATAQQLLFFCIGTLIEMLPEREWGTLLDYLK